MKLRGKRIWLLAVLPAIGLTLFLLSANWPTYRKLADRGTPARGQVTSTGCETGGLFSFTFEAEGELWAGHGRARRVGLSCAQLTPGRQVPVYFLPGDPASHAATNDPRRLARNELIVVGVFGLAALAASLLLVAVRIRKSPS